jgi:ABC-type Fe3+-siderophore transport system permease subunit
MSTLFPTLVYLLCFATSSACAFLLARSYLKARSRMLFWSALCFALLAMVNLIVIFDLVIYTDAIDLRPLRLWLTLLAISVLLFGFIWDEDS